MSHPDYDNVEDLIGYMDELLTTRKIFIFESEVKMDDDEINYINEGDNDINIEFLVKKQSYCYKVIRPSAWFS